MNTVGTITGLLDEIRSGRPGAADRLFQHVYCDVRKLARGRLRRQPAGEFQTTDLANAACERLLRRITLDAENRRHFFFMLNRAMRDVLVEQARANASMKRGGNWQHMPLEADTEAPRRASFDVLDVNDALVELEAIDKDGAMIVSLRFFSGRTLEEAAEILGCSVATVRRHWDYAKSWLHHRLST